MRIPLHMDPDDMSVQGKRERYLFHVKMAQLNPHGWRKIGKRRGVTKRATCNRLTLLAEAAFPPKGDEEEVVAKRGIAKRRNRQQHIKRLGSVRQRVLARMTNAQITWWQRNGRPEDHINFLAEEWGIE